MTYFLENVKAETNKALEFAVNLGISIPNPFSSFFFFLLLLLLLLLLLNFRETP